ncbi:hypothetical protein Q1695_006727 [Nippostrongylus brasiliensis]|nr:hypothetical protein Q1695_006727 [Nippostrongylus brasiliensis]
MTDAFLLCTQLISFLSVFINVYLLFVYIRCPLRRISSYKYFFPLAAAQDVVLSVSIMLAVPRTLANDHSIVFVATGPVRDKAGGSVLLGFYCIAFVSSLMLIANSFLYRYLQVCRAPQFESFVTKRNVVLVVTANVLLLAIWMVVIYVIFWPSAQFIQSHVEMVAMHTGLNSSDCGQLGLSFKHSVPALQLSLLLLFNIYLIIIASIIAYTAFKINATLREGEVSFTIHYRDRRT